MRCECPAASYDHTAGRCPREATEHIRRGETEMHVCNDCTFPGDLHLDIEEAE